MATRELLLFIIHLSQMTSVPIMIHNAQWKLYDQVSQGRQILNRVSGLAPENLWPAAPDNSQRKYRD